MTRRVRGLGDLVEFLSKMLGIKLFVKFLTKKFGLNCGCDERKEKLNSIKLPFDYGKK
jgi:hypothetical protein